MVAEDHKEDLDQEENKDLLDSLVPQELLVYLV